MSFKRNPVLVRPVKRYISSGFLADLEDRRLNGYYKRNCLQNSSENLYCRRFNNMNVCHYYYSDDKRVTEVATHHSKPLTVAGSKGGNMTLSDISGDVKEIYSWEGNGPGNSILDIKFPYHIDNKMLTASLDGTIKLWDLEKLRESPHSTLLNTDDYLKWFCSVAPSPTSGLILAGSNKGILYVLDKDFRVISTYKIHKSKINSIDFNTNSSNIFATASLDRSVKIFDIRKLDANSLERIEHSKPINTAVFSRKNGQRLLTSDQHSKIYIYQGPLWGLERRIIHPHRQFQHLTPIRASWHPFLDLIVIGRYPDKKLTGFDHANLKSIDIFSAETGNLKAELVTSTVKAVITSIAEFNYTGEILISGTGSLVIFWHFNQPSESIDCKTKRQMESEESEETSAITKKNAKKRHKN